MVIVLLLMLLLTFGTFLGVSMGVVIANSLHRWPTITILIPPNEAQLTATSAAFKQYFLETLWAKVTQKALTPLPTRTPKK
jgi:hypothetical protein